MLQTLLAMHGSPMQPHATILWTRRTPLRQIVHALNVLTIQNRGGLGGTKKERQLGVDGTTHAKVLLQERLALLSDNCMNDIYYFSFEDSPVLNSFVN